MDNLTHSLVGLAAAKAGIERWSPAATTLCVLAANAPDADILALFGGRWFYLHNHRGITHSIIGTLTLALLVPLLFYVVDRIIARLRGRPPGVRLPGLLLASLIVTATHPLMDWTNNYGLRPLLPWDGKWFYGDLVFIVDPWLWLGLGGAAFLLSSRTKWRLAAWAALALIITAIIFLGSLGRTGLAHPYIFRLVWVVGLGLIAWAYRLDVGRRFGRSVALLMLALVLVYWGCLAVVHHQALVETQAVATAWANQNNESLKQIAAMPTLGDPTHWQCIADTDRATYRFELFLWSKNESEAVRSIVRYEKLQGCASEALAQASKDERARVFLDFARFPVFNVQGDCLSQALVQFADLRYTEPGQKGRGTFSLEIPVSQAPEGSEMDKR